MDDDGNVYDGGYSGTSIMDKDYSAYRHHALLVADKTGTVEKTPPVEVVTPTEPVKEPLPENTTITMDDVLKNIIGTNYNTEMDTLKAELEKNKTEVDELKTEHDKALAEKMQRIEELVQETNTLREVNNGFANL